MQEYYSSSVVIIVIIIIISVGVALKICFHQ